MTKRVLIVDDEPIVIALLRDCFTSFQHGRAYEITSAGSVSEGFALLLRERFDLVLLDMVVPEPGRFSPGKQGLDLLKGIRTHGVDAPAS
jgi:CheY-like chemotaxis protein